MIQPPEQRASERGAGLLSASFGLLFFLGFLTLASQLIATLYRVTVVTGIAQDAAHGAAGAQLAQGAVCAPAMADAALKRAQMLLGNSRVAQVSTRCVGADLEVRVSLPKPALLALGDEREITRAAIVRSERLIEESA